MNNMFNGHKKHDCFSVISVSEAWTPESNSDPETLEDYRYIME